MQDDTKEAVLKINYNMVYSMLGILAALIGGVAWGVRLEFKTQENEKSNIKHTTEIDNLKDTSYSMSGRFGVLENDIKYIQYV